MPPAIPEFMSDQAAQMVAAVGPRAPRAVQRLSSAIDRLTVANSPGDYQSVALLCRDALIDYADSVFSPGFVPDGQPQPAHDQFVNKIAVTLSHFGDQAGSEKARKLVRALAGHVQSRQHDPTTDAAAAAGVVQLTISIVIETERLLRVATEADQLIQEFGIYRCPICRSRSLLKDEVVDYEDGDGFPHAVLAGWDLYCEECGWRRGP